MSEGGGDIIIKGSSVTLDFDDALYPKRQNGDPKEHKNPNRKITKIIIVETVNGEERVIFHSGENSAGLKFDTHFFTK